MLFPAKSRKVWAYSFAVRLFTRTVEIDMRLSKTKTAAAVCAAVMLCGCSLGSSSIDSLLAPPILSEEQDEIYAALTDKTGNNISLEYPKGGAYRSAFVTSDLDGDGQDEAAVFYTNLSDAEGTVRVGILDRSEGKWRLVYDHAGAGSSVEQVFFTELGTEGKVYMGIGYGYITPTEKTLKLYSLSDGILETKYTESYNRVLSLDLDRDGGRDIAVINVNNENHPASLSLVTDKGKGAEKTSSVNLNETAVDLPYAAAGFIGEGVPAVFVECLTQGGMLTTEIIYCVDGELRNPASIENSELPGRTQRVQGLYCRDIDGDGITEIPESEPFPGYREGSNAQYITNWNVFENYSVMKKYSSLTDTSLGYAFMLPVRWEGLVTVKNDSTTGEKVFYKYNGSSRDSRLELMRILVCDYEEAGRKALEGYITAASAENAVYMVRFGDTEDNLLLTTAEVTNNFYLLK